MKDREGREESRERGGERGKVGEERETRPGNTG